MGPNGSHSIPTHPPLEGEGIVRFREVYLPSFTFRPIYGALGSVEIGCVSAGVGDSTGAT